MKLGRRKGLAAAAVTTAAFASFGFVAPQKAAPLDKAGATLGMRVLRPAQVPAAHKANAFGKGAQVETDARTGAVRLITGAHLLAGTAGKAATADDLAAAAQRFVAAHPELGIDFAELELNQAATLLGKELQALKYKVKRQGLTVLDANVDFRFKDGTLVQVVNQTYAEAQADDRALEGGLERAAEAALIGGNATHTGDALRVVDDGQGYKLVRVALFDVKAQDDHLFKAQVEAATGKVFELRDSAFYLSGSAKGSAYPRTWWHDDPLTLMAYRDVKLTYSGGSVTTDADGNFVNAPASARPAINGLEGARVKVIPSSGTRISASGAADATGNWNVTYTNSSAPAAEDKILAQSMTYYHLNREISHAKAYISTPWLDQQLTANVNLNDVCNAYWDGSTINLFSAGSGCANTGLISDVYYHEWGHGLDDNTGGIEDDAFSEGYGDIMSLLLTHDHVLGKGFMTADGAGVRDLTTLKKYPADSGAEAHTAGLIIAGTFWDLYNNLKANHSEAEAGDILSKLALNVIFTAARYTDVYAALLVIDKPSAEAANGPNFCAINKAFTRHGLARADSSCN
jgi:hypothetical protein